MDQERPDHPTGKHQKLTSAARKAVFRNESFTNTVVAAILFAISADLQNVGIDCISTRGIEMITGSGSMPRRIRKQVSLNKKAPNGDHYSFSEMLKRTADSGKAYRSASMA